MPSVFSRNDAGGVCEEMRRRNKKELVGTDESSCWVVVHLYTIDTISNILENHRIKGDNYKSYLKKE